MLSKSRHPCENCRKERKKCGKERPACRNCVEGGLYCKYELILHWGGRPYKDVRKKSKAFGGLSIVNGVLVLDRKEKSVKSQCDKVRMYSQSFSLLKPPRIVPVLKSQRAMSFLVSSANYRSLWTHFIEQTSRILVAKKETDKGHNPFCVTIPALAKQSVTLTKLVVAFSARHRYQLYKQIQDYHTSQKLLGEAGKELVEVINLVPNMDKKIGEQTLACILVLASYCVFFGDRKLRWSIHLDAARYIISVILSHDVGTRKQRSMVVKYCADPSPLFFLMRWFAFMSVLGGLSSAHLANSDSLVFDFSGLNQQLETAELSRHFKDFEYNIGMRIKTLELLMKVGKLVMIYEDETRQPLEEAKESILGKAIELDYEIMKDISNNEAENQSLAFSEEDKLLLATDLLFGLSGMLHLRRRIMRLASTSKLVNELVLQAAGLLRREIPSKGPVLCGINSCIFAFGCECTTGSGLESLRSLFLNRLEQIVTLGISTTNQAKEVMMECWATGSSWWQLYRERNIEPSFGI